MHKSLSKSDFLNRDIFIRFCYNIFKESKIRSPFFNSLKCSLLPLMTRIQHINNDILWWELWNSFRNRCSVSEPIDILQHIPKRSSMIIRSTCNKHCRVLDILKNILIRRVTRNQIIKELFLRRIPELIVIRSTQRLLLIKQTVQYI